MLRVGIALMTLAWLPVVLAYNAPGDASIRYWLFVLAHLLNVGGFFLAALDDALAKRPFSATRLVYTIAMEVLLLVLGPVFMSAAAAYMKGHPQ
jgi:hypothetical protein